MTYEFKTGDKCKTRDGREAEVLADDMGGDYPLAVRIYSRNGTWWLGAFAASGKHLLDCASSKDLMPQPIVRYHNAYAKSFGCHASRGAADESAGSDRIACIRVEYTPGQFDD